MKVRNMAKRILSLALSAVLCLSCLPLETLATSRDVQEDNEAVDTVDGVFSSEMEPAETSSPDSELDGVFSAVLNEEPEVLFQILPVQLEEEEPAAEPEETQAPASSETETVNMISQVLPISLVADVSTSSSSAEENDGETATVITAPYSEEDQVKRLSVRAGSMSSNPYIMVVKSDHNFYSKGQIALEAMLSGVSGFTGWTYCWYVSDDPEATKGTLITSVPGTGISSSDNEWMEYLIVPKNDTTVNLLDGKYVWAEATINNRTILSANKLRIQWDEKFLTEDVELVLPYYTDSQKQVATAGNYKLLYTYEKNAYIPYGTNIKVSTGDGNKSTYRIDRIPPDATFRYNISDTTTVYDWYPRMNDIANNGSNGEGKSAVGPYVPYQDSTTKSGISKESVTFDMTVEVDRSSLAGKGIRTGSYGSYFLTGVDATKLVIMEEGSGTVNVDAEVGDVIVFWRFSGLPGQFYYKESASATTYTKMKDEADVLTTTQYADGVSVVVEVTQAVMGQVYYSGTDGVGYVICGGPEITTQPKDQTVKKGNSATFSVTATGTGTLKYQWQKSSTKTGTYTNIEGATKESYTTGSTQKGDNGYYYRCTVTDDYGNITSSSAKLTVCYAPASASVGNKAAEVGSYATFNVTVATAGNPTSYTYSWYVSKNNGVSYSAVGSGDGTSTSATFKTVAVTKNMSGYKYRCKVSNGYGTVTSTEGTLTVYYPPENVTVGNVSLQTGEQAIFAVSIGTEGNPASYKYQWEISTDSGSSYSNVSTSHGTGGTTEKFTTVAATSSMNGYKYRCIVKNYNGSTLIGTVTSGAGTLTVTTGVKPTIITNPEGTMVVENQAATFSVRAQGTNLTYIWQYKKVAGNTWSTVTTSMAKFWGDGQTIQLTANRNQHKYSFRCIVSNDLGTATSSEAVLQVLYSATLSTLVSKEVWLYTGDSSFSFTGKISTAGNPASYTYQWQIKGPNSGSWENIEDGSGEVYEFSGATTLELNGQLVESTNACREENGAQFRLAVTNQGGTVYSSAATLTVSWMLIQRQPESVSVRIGEQPEISFDCETSAAHEDMYRSLEKWNGESWESSVIIRHNEDDVCTCTGWCDWFNTATDGGYFLTGPAATEDINGTYRIKLLLSASLFVYSDEFDVTVLNAPGTPSIYSVSATDWSKENVKIKIKAGEHPFAGGQNLQYRYANGSWITGWKNISGGNILYVHTASKEGISTIEFRAVNAEDSDLVSETITTTVKIDKSAPVISEVSVPEIEKIKVAVSDKYSGLSQYAVGTNASSDPAEWTDIPDETSPFTFSAPGSGTYYVWVKDKAGNVSSVSEAILVESYTAPNAPTITSPAPGNTEWYRDKVTVSVTAGTPGTGGQRLQYQLNSTTGTWTNFGASSVADVSVHTFDVAKTNTGINTVYVRAVNTSDTTLTSGTVSTTVRIDTVPPVISYTLDPASDWTNVGVKLKFTVSDSQSRPSDYYQLLWNEEQEDVDLISNEWLLTENADDYCLHVFDKAGNKTEITFSVTNIDTTIPTIGSIAATSGATNTTQTITISDLNDNTGGSGLTSYGYSMENDSTKVTNWTSISSTATSAKFTVNKNGTWYAWVKDVAGNVSASKSVTVSNIYTKVTSATLSYAKTTLALNENGGFPTLTISPSETKYYSVSYATGKGNSSCLVLDSTTGQLAGGKIGSDTVTATITNFDGSTVKSNAVTITVQDSSISITKQPEDVRVKEKEKLVKFEVTATGTNLKYQWYYNTSNSTTDGTPIDDATSATYSIAATNVTRSLDGYYYCLVSNGSNTATTRAAKLTVYYEFSISKQATDQKVKSGTAVEFSVTVTGGNPDTYTYTWYQNSTDSSTGGTQVATTASSTLTSNTYTIATENVTSGLNGKYYYCKVSNGQYTLTSDVVQLTVYWPPEITIPEAISGNAGDTGKAISVSVKTAGNPSTISGYQWQYRDGSNGTWTNVDTGSGGTTVKYTLPKLELKMKNYQYRCLVSTSQYGGVASNILTLTVTDVAPTITNPTADTTVTVKVGNEGSMSVTATGTNLKYQWQVYQNNTWVNVSTGSNGTSATYTTEATSEGMNGQKYRCEVSNDAGKVVSKTFTLDVQYPAKTATVGDVTVNEQQQATFTVTASGGNPNKYTYQWEISKDEGKTWSDVDGGDGTVSNTTDTSCEFKTVKATMAMDGYQYRCTVTNAGGDKVSGVGTLTVKDITPPNNVKLTISNQNWTNQAATLTASAQDNVGVTGYYFVSVAVDGAAPTTKPAVNDSGWTTSTTKSVSKYADWYVWAKDAAGNMTLSNKVTDRYDRQLPEVTKLVADPSDWTKENITLTATANDKAASGDHGQCKIAGYYFASVTVGGTPPAAPAANASGWQTGATKQVTKYADWYVWVKDEAGNVSVLSASGAGTDGVDKVTASYDRNPPTVDQLVLSSTAPSGIDLTLTAAASDPAPTGDHGQSGIYGYYFAFAATGAAVPTAPTQKSQFTAATTAKANEQAVTENGTWYCWVMDEAGNISASASKQVTNIDKLEPEVTKLEADPSGWTNGTITLKAEANDATATASSAQSGIAGYYFSMSSTAPAGNATTAKSSTCSGWQSGNTFGVTKYGTWYVWVKDNADNVSAASTKSVTAYYDSVKPSVSIKDNATSWTNQNVILRAEPTDATDANSGSSGTTADGTGKVGYTYYWSTSSTAPTITSTWTSNSTQTVTINDTWYLWVKDAAGNISARASVKVEKIDKTKPSTPTLREYETAHINPGQTRTIEVKSTDLGDGGDPNTPSGLYEYTIDNGATWTTLPSNKVTASNGEVTFRFAFTVPGTGSAAKCTVKVRDAAGNVSEPTTLNLTNVHPKQAVDKLVYTNQESEINTALKTNTVTVWDTSTVVLQNTAGTTTYVKGTDFRNMSYAVGTGETTYATVNATNGTLTGVDYRSTAITVTVTITDWDNTTYTRQVSVKVLDEKPTITDTTNPADKTVWAGKSVSFTTNSASGSNNVFTWHVIDNVTHTDSVITSGQNGYTISTTPTKHSTTSTLTIAASSVTARLDDNKYYCVVSNTRTNGTTTPALTAPKSREARLTVNLKLKVTLRTVSDMNKSFSSKDFSGDELRVLNRRSFNAITTTPTGITHSTVSNITSNYHVYGTTNANKQLGLALLTDNGEKDLKGLSSVTKVKGVKLYNAAAYNSTAADRKFVVLLKDSAASTRQQIEITVEIQVGARSLSFTVDTALSISLQPGMTNESETVAATFENNSAFPIDVSLGTVSKQTTGTPSLIQQSYTYTETDQLEQVGLKLGVKDTDGSNKKYYDPNASATSQTVFAQLTAGSSTTNKHKKQFKYFIEFSPLYLGTQTNFSYGIIYNMPTATGDRTP